MERFKVAGNLGVSPQTFINVSETGITSCDLPAPEGATLSTPSLLTCIARATINLLETVYVYELCRVMGLDTFDGDTGIEFKFRQGCISFINSEVNHFKDLLNRNLNLC